MNGRVFFFWKGKDEGKEGIWCRFIGAASLVPLGWCRLVGAAWYAQAELPTPAALC
jgi:hypothetical protein